MAGVGPVAGHKQNVVKQPKLDAFSGHAVDLPPVAQPNSVFPHQHEPADEAHNEIFESNCEARTSKSEKRPKLSWEPNDHHQNKEYRRHLNGDARYRAERFHLPAIQRQFSKQTFEPTVK